MHDATSPTQMGHVMSSSKVIISNAARYRANIFIRMAQNKPNKQKDNCIFFLILLSDKLSISLC